MSLEDRLVNPLGFKAVSYRRSAEAPPPAQVQVQPTVVRPVVAQVAVPVAPVGQGVELRRVPVASPLTNGGQ